MECRTMIRYSTGAMKETKFKGGTTKCLGSKGVSMWRAGGNWRRCVFSPFDMVEKGLDCFVTMVAVEESHRVLLRRWRCPLSELQWQSNGSTNSHSTKPFTITTHKLRIPSSFTIPIRRTLFLLPLHIRTRISILCTILLSTVHLVHTLPFSSLSDS